jgi:hypothetical protein
MCETRGLRQRREAPDKNSNRLTYKKPLNERLFSVNALPGLTLHYYSLQATGVLKGKKPGSPCPVFCTKVKNGLQVRFNLFLTTK